MIVMTVATKSKSQKVEYGRLIAFVQQDSAGSIKAIVRWWMQGSTVEAKHRQELVALDPPILTKELFYSEYYDVVDTRSFEPPLAHNVSFKPSGCGDPFYRRAYNVHATGDAFCDMNNSTGAHRVGSEVSPLQVSSNVSRSINVALQKLGHQEFREGQFECAARLLAGGSLHMITLHYIWPHSSAYGQTALHMVTLCT